MNNDSSESRKLNQGIEERMEHMQQDAIMRSMITDDLYSDGRPKAHIYEKGMVIDEENFAGEESGASADQHKHQSTEQIERNRRRNSYNSDRALLNLALRPVEEKQAMLSNAMAQGPDEYRRVREEIKAAYEFQLDHEVD